MHKPLAERSFISVCTWTDGSVRFTGAELDELGFDAEGVERVERLGVGQSAGFHEPFNGWAFVCREA